MLLGSTLKSSLNPRRCHRRRRRRRRRFRLELLRSACSMHLACDVRQSCLERNGLITSEAAEKRCVLLGLRSATRSFL